MSVWTMTPSSRATPRRTSPSVFVVVLGSLAAGGCGLGGAAQEAPVDPAGPIAGMAAVSGTVDAPRPFQAAQVYLRNVDKAIGYMVFTDAGRFRAVALLPGRYEVRVEAPGLASEVETLVLAAGDAAELTASLRDSADAGVSTGGRVSASYDEIYPPGPGRVVAEEVCMACHGQNFLSTRPSSEGGWRTRIDHMVGSALLDRDARSYAEGLLGGRPSAFRFSRQDRADLLAYLVEHFGPDSTPRVVRTDRPMPLDEAVLGTAMYIEYYLPPDPPGQGVNAPEYADLTVPFAGRRVGQDVRFDADGNVWLTDRGYPHRLVKLDPRTGEQTDYELPDPDNGIHDVLVDRDGIVWTAEHEGATPSQVKRLLGFNPRTEAWEYQIPMDPEHVVRNTDKWLQSLAVDSKGNIYVGWIMGGALSKWDRATNEVSVFRLPTSQAIAYGVVADRDDNIWIAQWSGGKLAKFDTTANQWTEFTPPTFPAQVRRLNVDAQNNVWAGIWAAGKRPGALARLDQTTGRFTEWAIPQQNAQPYDVMADADGHIWFADSPMPDRAAALGRFDPRDETFTFYPRPQFSADTPKIQVTRDGAVWYSPRGSRDLPAIGVLYPDMDRITTLGAYYLNGPPGYAFTVAGR